MATLRLEIPDHVFLRLRKQAAERGFSTAEDLVVDLIHGATTNAASHRILSEDRPEELEAELIRRIESDDWVVMDDADFLAMHARLDSRRKERTRD